MHYGNLKFKQKQREEQAEPDGTEGTSTNYTRAQYRPGHSLTQAVKFMVGIIDPACQEARILKLLLFEAENKSQCLN